MIQVEKLSYGFPAKDLYRDISFTIETGQHCALIGSNGAGKSTLADMLMQPDEYFFDGKIIRDDSCRVGYAGQFSLREKLQDCTVFEYLSRRFLAVQQEIERVCGEMAEALPEEMERLFAQYQSLLDVNEAMDGDNYESSIRRQLHLAGMEHLENTGLPQISGGEYKLVQIMREMLLSPNLLILDEPDVFLDFEKLNGLAAMINGYRGTLLAVTHNRYLLNHCFNKILHLENGQLQEFDGTYSQYRCAVLREKLALRIQHAEEQAEIARTQEMVDIYRRRATLMVNPVIGKTVNAKQSQLDRLLARQIAKPFIEVREPEIVLPEIAAAGEFGETAETAATEVFGEKSKPAEKLETARKTETSEFAEASSACRPLLRVTDYGAEFGRQLLQGVSFELYAGEKVAVTGANGTGKTTLVRDILSGRHPAVELADGVRYACLSQLQGKPEGENRTVYEVMQEKGFGTKESLCAYLSKFCFPAELADQRLYELSGGEQNLLQIALISASDAELLILDEPTSHLDIYAQMALERAIAAYKGTVLMVSHDFYLISSCADYVLLAEGGTLRRMRTKNFRRMVYERYFDRSYLETDRKKQELEMAVTAAFEKNDFAAVDKMCTELETLSGL